MKTKLLLTKLGIPTIGGIALIFTSSPIIGYIIGVLVGFGVIATSRFGVEERIREEERKKITTKVFNNISSALTIMKTEEGHDVQTAYIFAKGMWAMGKNIGALSDNEALELEGLIETTYRYMRV